jgi:uncharacterized membrane protein
MDLTLVSPFGAGARLFVDFAFRIAAFISQPRIVFPANPEATGLMFMRWLHIIFGVLWIGLLYFFNLVATPTMKRLEPAVRVKIYPQLMPRAMSWFRWSALVTVIMGLSYFFRYLATDAHNAGDPGLAWRWFGWWWLVWIVAYGLIYGLQLPMKGFLDNGWVRALGIAMVVIAASWLVLALNGGSTQDGASIASNEHLAIGVGGGLGLLMLLNTWGVVWRVQKRLISWTRSAAEHGTPMPAEAERLMRWGFIAARVGFWLSFPMLFFMGAASHYPFLTSVAR